jgi:hypothetical protein
MMLARFLILLGRARQCGQDPKGAIDPLQDAMEIFNRAGSSIEEATAASLLAACGQQSGDSTRSAAHLQDVVKIMEREGAATASVRAAAALTARELAAS